MKFGLTEAKVSVPRLKPWTINEVTFKGVEYKNGTSQNGNNWAAMQFNFEGENGTYSKMFFCPNQNGFERRSGESSSGKWVLPADAEVLMEQLKYICTTLAKDAYAKVAGKIVVDLPGEFDKLYEYIAKILKGAVGTKTNIKLVADNRGYADIPRNAVRISSSDDSVYISNRWLGDNLSFSAYELKTKDAAKAETPSKVDDLTTDDSLDNVDDLLDI